MSKDKQMYICNYASCRKSFTRKHDWSRHLDTHLGVSFHCDKCGKTFSRLNSLKNHTKQCSNRPQPYASMEGQLLDITPVLPIMATNVNTPTSATGPSTSGQAGMWMIQTDRSKSVNKAIKLLSKYHNFDPITPSASDSHKNPRIPQSNPGNVTTTPAQKLMDLSDTKVTDPNKACTRTITLPTAHASDKSAIKRVTFEQEHTLIPAAPLKRTEGFKRRVSHAQKPKSTDKQQKSTSDQSKAPNAGLPTKRRHEDCHSPSTAPGKLERKPLPFPKLIPLEMDMVEEKPDKSLRKGTNTKDPRGAPAKPLDMPDGMPPFITEPESEDLLWKGMFDTPERIVSPVGSLPMTDSHLSPVCEPPKTPTPPEDPNSIQENPTPDTDCIGYISPSDGESTPNKEEPIPDICVTTNGIIVDIIAELSMINDVAMQRNLSTHQKPLKRILGKLRKVTKLLD